MDAATRAREAKAHANRQCGQGKGQRAGSRRRPVLAAFPTISETLDTIAAAIIATALTCYDIFQKIRVRFQR